MINDTMDVILVNRYNQSDEFRTVLPAKLCVRVLLILMLAAAAVLVVGAASGAAEKTWYVDDGGGEGINFTRIQDAVNNASDGDTIIVYGGTYKEAIAVNEQLILRGIDHPVVDGNGSWACIAISVDCCIVDGFNITGGVNSGIYINSDYNTIINCSIYDNGDDGVRLDDSDYTIIANNAVLNNSDDGIKLWHSSHNLLTNNIINSNEDEGVDFSHSNNNTIAGSILSNNYGYGVYLSDSSNNIVANNTISLSASDGVGLEEDSHYNYIINNSIFDNYDEGLELSVSSHNTIINNTVYSNTENGIDVKGSLYNYIANNTVYLNGETGVELSRSWGTEPVVWGSSHNTITSNVIYLNDDGGVKLKNSSDNIITYNIAYANEDTGIYLKNSSDNQIYNNNLIDNDEQASDDGSDNSWDLGQTVGGNYWSDHECTGNPSNGAQPYYIDADSVDHYPFADPIGEIPQLPAPVPKADTFVDKTERLVTSDTCIDHNQIYNFDIEWYAGVWDVKNLDNVTYMITTPIDLTVFCSPWELYQNGSTTCSALPFDHVEENYTWTLPLKDRLASTIDFYTPDKTVQDNPWVDMVVDTINEYGYTRVNVTLIPRIPSLSVDLTIEGRIIDISYPPEFETEEFYPDHTIEFCGDWEDMNPGQSYNFSILVDDPKEVELWLDKTHGGYTEYSNTVTLPVSELGSVTVACDVPVKWNLDTTQPQYTQGITITMNGSSTPSQKGDLNSDGYITPADAAIALRLAAAGAHDDAADVSGDGEVTSLDALMILKAAAGGIAL